MKRPFAVLGFTYLTALMVALFVGSNIAYILSGALAVLFVISLVVKKLRKRIALPFIFITSAVAMLMFSTFVEQKLKTVEVLSGTEQRITATVCDEVYESMENITILWRLQKSEIQSFQGLKSLQAQAFCMMLMFMMNLMRKFLYIKMLILFLEIMIFLRDIFCEVQ